MVEGAWLRRLVAGLPALPGDAAPELFDERGACQRVTSVEFDEPGLEIDDQPGPGIARVGREAGRIAQAGGREFRPPAEHDRGTQEEEQGAGRRRVGMRSPMLAEASAGEPEGRPAGFKPGLDARRRVLLLAGESTLHGLVRPLLGEQTEVLDLAASRGFEQREAFPHERRVAAGLRDRPGAFRSGGRSHVERA